MKYIITEGQFEDGIIRYLNEMYGDLKEYRTDKYPEFILFIRDKKVYMIQDLRTRKLVADNNTIWEDLKTMFGLNYDESLHIIKKWMEETYKSKGFTPVAGHVVSFWDARDI